MPLPVLKASMEPVEKPAGFMRRWRVAHYMVRLICHRELLRRRLTEANPHAGGWVPPLPARADPVRQGGLAAADAGGQQRPRRCRPRPDQLGAQPGRQEAPGGGDRRPCALSSGHPDWQPGQQEAGFARRSRNGALGEGDNGSEARFSRGPRLPTFRCIISK